MKERLFGTDGVRGIANKDLTPELAMKLGRAGAYVLAKESAAPTFVIGMDTRISGTLLEDALCAGILSMGGNVIRVGVIPTPGVAFLVKEQNADAGVVISASHNPYEYNGIKFFDRNGYKLSVELEDEIQHYVEEGVPKERLAEGAAVGREILPEADLHGLYKAHVAQTFEGRLDGVRLVLDCANGASSAFAADVYRSLGAEVTVIANEPDGVNINENCGSTHPEQLQETVCRVHADFGLAFDGDADRMVAVDETGAVADGDGVIGVCGWLLKEKGILKDQSLTVTTMSNIGLHLWAREQGIEVHVTDVGDRFVLESMRKTGCNIGGEQSGHIIFTDYSTTGDGMVAGLQLLKACKHFGMKLSELMASIRIYPQVTVNAKVRKEKKMQYESDDEIKKAIKEAGEKVKENGRILVRPSGTEPLVRVTLEGDNIHQIRKIAEGVAQLIEKKLG